MKSPYATPADTPTPDPMTPHERKKLGFGVESHAKRLMDHAGLDGELDGLLFEMNLRIAALKHLNVEAADVSGQHVAPMIEAFAHAVIASDGTITIEDH